MSKKSFVEQLVEAMSKNPSADKIPVEDKRTYCGNSKLYSKESSLEKIEQRSKRK